MKRVLKAQALPLTFGEMRSAFEWVDLTNRDFIQVYVSMQDMIQRIFIEKQRER